MSFNLILTGVVLGLFSGFCWVIEGKEYGEEILTAAACCRTRLDGFFLPFKIIGALPKAFPLILDLAATFALVFLFNMGMSTLGVVIGLAVSDAISIGILCMKFKSRRIAYSY